MSRAIGCAGHTRNGVRVLLPPAAVVLALAVIGNASGLQFSEVIRQIAYDALFVVGPGVLVVRAFDKGASPLRLAALGWAAGLTLSPVAFMLSAEIGSRELFYAYPVVCASVAWRCARGRRRTRDVATDAERAAGLSAPTAWTLAAIAVAAFLITWPLLLHAEPLPRDIPAAITYDADTLYYLGLGADAEQHGLPSYAGVLGAPLGGPTLAFMDAGGRAFVTDVDTTSVMLRYQHLSLVVAALLMFALAGSRIGRRAWAGPAAAALALVAGELDLDRQPSITSLFGFPPYLVTEEQVNLLLGALLYVAVVLLLYELIESTRDSGRVDRPKLALALAFTLAAGEAKGAAVPVLVGGAALYVIWAWRWQREVLRGALVAFGVTIAGFLFVVLVVTGGGTGGLALDPLQAFEKLPMYQDVLAAFGHGEVHDVAERLFVVVWVTGISGGLLCGVPWALLLAPKAQRAALVWPLCCLAASAPPMLLFDHVASGQHEFLWFGIYAAIPIAAAGLVALAARWPRVMATGFGGLTSAMVIVVLLQPGSDLVSHVRWSIAFAFVLPLGGAAIAVAASRCGRWEVALVVLTAGAVAAATLDRPIDVLSRLPVLDERGISTAPATRLTPDLYDGFRWIDKHAAADATLALGPLASDDEPYRYFLLTAFGQRRVFIEGPGYSNRAYDVGIEQVLNGSRDPYPERTRLNRRAFAGDDRARRALARSGVDYLVIDRVNGERLNKAKIGRPVFQTRALAVFAVERRTRAPDR